MKTPYSGQAMIGDLQANVDIANVDVAQWKGVVTDVHGSAALPEEPIVRLLEQPRPGWSARARATETADGVLQLDGVAYFHAAAPRSDSAAKRSLWVKKPPIAPSR